METALTAGAVVTASEKVNEVASPSPSVAVYVYVAVAVRVVGVPWMRRWAASKERPAGRAGVKE